MSRQARTWAPAGALPPWQWLWLALYLVNVPALVEGWRQLVAVIAGADPLYPELVGTPSLTLFRLFSVVQLLPPLALFCGVVIAFLPWARAAWVQWRFGLRADDRPLVREMQAFVDGYAPGLRLRVNLMRSDRVVRIYPTGWRTARIAVFAPLAKLWRGDPVAAKTLLLHEIAHYRNGDQLIVGLGSPFVFLVNVWLPSFVLAGLLPLGILFAQDYPTAAPLTAQVALLVTQIPRLLLLPVAGLWLAELAADRYVLDLGGAAPLTRCVASAGRARGRWWRLGALARLSHPPRWLRRRACRPTEPGDAGLLAVWSLLPLGVLALALAGGILGWRLLDYPWDQIGAAAFVNSRSFLIDAIPTWTLALAFIALWPVLSRAWTWLWARELPARPTPPARTYAAAAVVPATLLVATLVLAGCTSMTGRPVAATRLTTTTETTTTTPTTTTTEPAETTTEPSQETTTTEPEVDDEPVVDTLSGTFDVTLTGTASGNYFERTATLSFEPTISEEGTTNGVNPIDVCLISGFPGAQPEPGAIWLGSNSGCNPGASAANIDMGSVETDDATVNFAPDPDIAATMANNFTASGGLTACIYAPVDGWLTVTVSADGSVSGSISITGYGGAMCGNSGYEAELSG
jgi:Zn-dependent protease with chaperone function